MQKGVEKAHPVVHVSLLQITAVGQRDSQPGTKPPYDLTKVVMGLGCWSGQDRTGTQNEQVYTRNRTKAAFQQLLRETGPSLYVAWEWLQQVCGTGEEGHGIEGYQE